jgi:hypothetical protein
VAVVRSHAAVILWYAVVVVQLWGLCGAIVCCGGCAAAVVILSRWCYRMLWWWCGCGAIACCGGAAALVVLWCYLMLWWCCSYADHDSAVLSYVVVVLQRC